MRPFRLALLALALTMASTACQKKSDSSSASTFSQIYSQTLSTTTCKSCHSPGGMGTVDGASLDFSDASTAYTTLLNSRVTSTTNAGTCGSVRIVAAGSPTLSYLVGMFVESYRLNNFAGVSGCLPSNTHIQAGYMSAIEQESLLSWINAGALNN